MKKPAAVRVAFKIKYLIEENGDAIRVIICRGKIEIAIFVEIGGMDYPRCPVSYP